MKFISEPVKYKQLYRWVRQVGCNLPRCRCTPDGWRPRNSAGKLNLAITKLPGGGGHPSGYYIAPLGKSQEYVGSSIHTLERWRMIGPFPDLPTAKSVAEVFVTMRQGPRWVWKRPKKGK